MAPTAQIDILRYASHGIDDLHLLVELHAVLREIAEAYSLAHDEAPAVGLHEAEQHLDERALARAVGAHNAHLLIPREVVIEILQDDALRAGGIIGAWREGLADVLCLEDLGTDIGAVHLQRYLVLVDALLGTPFQVLEGLLAVTCLMTSCLRHASHPFQLTPI